MSKQQDELQKLQTQLAETQKELEEARNEIKKITELQDKFIKDAIHEIHTPLSIIITNKDLIRMNYGDIKFLNSIEAACKVIQNSYEDMAYHAQMDNRDMHSTNIDLAGFVDSRCEYFDSIAKANEINIVFKSNLACIFIKIAEPKLQRLVDNNISNAIKYAKAGSTVTISVKIVENELLLEFTNIGRVIHDKEAVFKRFHREDNVRGGYGIGLSLVYEICESEKIGIKLTSSAKTGTTFCYIFKNFKIATIDKDR